MVRPRLSTQRPSEKDSDEFKPDCIDGRRSEEDLDQFILDCIVKWRLSEQRRRSEEDLSLNGTDLKLAIGLMMLSKGLVDADFKKHSMDMDGERLCSKLGKEYVSPTALTESTTAMNGSTLGSYKCSECEKEFRSYQALGGHRASHRKSLPNFKEAKTVKSTAGGGGGRGGGVHECTICHKKYPTGQALGGHMRRHYGGNLGKENQPNHQVCNFMKNDVTKSDGIRSSLSPREFDLNVPALPEFSPDLDEEVHSRY